MKYQDERVVRVGDRVKLRNGEYGLVVLSVDTQEDSPEFLLEDWKNLPDGILIRTEQGVLVAFHADAGEEFYRI